VPCWGPPCGPSWLLCFRGPQLAPLEGLRVVELRRLVRRRGLPQLARSGRRAELLQALAATPG